MTRLMPLRRVVVELTHEAPPEDLEKIRRAIKSWHNRLSNGSIPRTIIAKLGRELFLDLGAWEDWLAAKERQHSKIGRPRTQE